MVVVTTKHRGIFAGDLVKEDGRTVTLKNARNCISWDSVTKGFLGLAAKGPTAGCKVGPAAPELKIYDVTSIAECSEEAAKAWESEPWS